MLDKDSFKLVIKNAPLVSIDLCIVHKNKILLGKRNNEPLKEQWFTPGGRIFKNETWSDCLNRIIKNELGLNIDDIDEKILMGIWDHFYKNSFIDSSISTHYVNLPHYIPMLKKPFFRKDDQHNSMDWFNLEEVANDKMFHKYMQNYASWIIDYMHNIRNKHI